ncbi:gamma-glutamyl phosphate reductase [Chloroherpeton thalassium ATCC 35110]|uniref:Gamma-glutamyl phosphate reductase n=1 Tax=Chloroherpeton thalassium (strain ATCC 35110 / GB-78) TaxID=517418 RepID=B3QRW1_CHLT3|nr:glutamate-5-semialdehyde dehydrogenase [Chloroherpeton thalassium]ACF13914.1 gamma-glutamyl phosphate reductase [Chloroherpeton thalassium ATCC 35110]
MQNINQELEKVVAASRKAALLEETTINEVLGSLADAALAETAFILEENKKDLARMPKSDPKYDRLMLTEARIEGIANDIRNVAKLPSPLGKILDERDLQSGLHLQKVTVPLGVIGIIYEARPNVTFDVFSLCLKSGNATVLKGGSDAHYSNLAIVSVIHKVLAKHGLDTNTVFLLPSERAAVEIILNATNFVDIIIPRGSQNLINFVREHSKVPVIETGAGIVHTYFDASGDLEKGKAIVFNAKTRRPSVCNALDTLVIHESRLADLPEIAAQLAEKHVELFADEKAFSALSGNYPEALLQKATAESFGTEFLSLKMSIKTVSGLDEALEHIAKYSSKHSEAVVAEDNAIAERFLKSVDAAVVYANTSTAYTDGAQFGLGAEIGISTQKLHARGPMALAELTSYKWVIRGNGEVRPA